MQLNVPPDLVTLINKRLSGGGYQSVEDGCAAPLKLRTPRRAGPRRNAGRCRPHIEEGYQQAERGELIDGAQARREIQAMKDDWRLSKR
jgi:hypothetical protein